MVLCENTNAYAEAAGANIHTRYWQEVTVNEMKLFIACCIHIGIKGAQNITSLWHPPQLPMQYISESRFEQIKRYLHLSHPYSIEKSTHSKLRYLFDAINQRHKGERNKCFVTFVGWDIQRQKHWEKHIKCVKLCIYAPFAMLYFARRIALRSFISKLLL